MLHEDALTVAHTHTHLACTLHHLRRPHPTMLPVASHSPTRIPNQFALDRASPSASRTCARATLKEEDAVEKLVRVGLEAEVLADLAPPLEGVDLLARDERREARPRLLARRGEVRRRVELLGDVRRQRVAPAQRPVVAEVAVLLERDAVEPVALARVLRRLPKGRGYARPRVAYEGTARFSRGTPKGSTRSRVGSPRAAGGWPYCGSAACPPRSRRRPSWG